MRKLPAICSALILFIFTNSAQAQGIGNVIAALDQQLSAFVQLWADNGIFWKQGTQYNGMRFATATGKYAENYSEKMRIMDNGNLGIGTSNPTSRLQVSGGNIAATVNDQFTAFVQLWSDNAIIWKNGSISNGLRFGSANDLNAAGFTEKMRIMDNGVVCIGTVLNNAPDYKLFVESGIRTRKVKVDQVNPWPDYVFHANYRLRPLNEVEQYIKQNGHLPDVASEEEVKKEGIDLGDNQATLLKKIEELTLYMIEQNKKQENQEKLIQEQSKLLQAQQQRLEELEKQIKEKH